MLDLCMIHCDLTSKTELMDPLQVVDSTSTRFNKPKGRVNCSWYSKEAEMHQCPPRKQLTTVAKLRQRALSTRYMTSRHQPSLITDI